MISKIVQTALHRAQCSTKRENGTEKFSVYSHFASSEKTSASNLKKNTGKYKRKLKYVNSTSHIACPIY